MNSSNYKISFLIAVLIFAFAKARTNRNIDSTYISESFEEFAQLPREQIYLHLNKSVYLKQESIGFSAYVFNTRTGAPSQESRNVYVDVINKNGNVIKQKLVLANDGKAANQFYIDSLFTKGKYRVRAYTNYLRNFNENLHAEQDILVLDPAHGDEFPVYDDRMGKLDVQIMPEGGHILSGVSNTLGILVKDTMGFGVENLNGRLMSGNTELTSFRTDEFGMARITLLADIEKDYNLEMEVEGDLLHFELPEFQRDGILLSVKRRLTDVMVHVKTNDSSFDYLKDQAFTLFIHDGSNGHPIHFSMEKTDMVFRIPFTEMRPGINVLTLFDKSNNPVSERLVFNYHGLDIGDLGSPVATVSTDTVNVSLPISKLPSSDNGYVSASISILPTETIAYQTHHDIISHTYLKPFIKGRIQNGSYYFKNIDDKKKYQLDNLLITQGFSAYDWQEIFKSKPSLKYDFEDGISARLKFNLPRPNKIRIHGSRFSPDRTIKIADDTDDMLLTGFTPLGNDGIWMSRIRNTGGERPLKASLVFEPKEIPEWKKSMDYLGVQPFPESEKNTLADITPFLGAGKYLEEVVIEADRNELRKAEIERKTRGDVFIMDDRNRNLYANVPAFLATKGFQVQWNEGNLEIVRSGFQGVIPTISLDGWVIGSPNYVDGVFNILNSISMEEVDYIVIDKGLGGTSYGGNLPQPTAAGVIEIKTRTNSDYTAYNYASYYKVPLTFADYEKFYVPEYIDYTSDFFKQFGVIDWIAYPFYNQDNQSLEFEFIDRGYNAVKLFIQGTDNEGKLYSEEVKLELTRQAEIQN